MNMWAVPLAIVLAICHVSEGGWFGNKERCDENLKIKYVYENVVSPGLGAFKTMPCASHYCMKFHQLYAEANAVADFKIDECQKLGERIFTGVSASDEIHIVDSLPRGCWKGPLYPPRCSSFIDALRRSCWSLSQINYFFSILSQRQLVELSTQVENSEVTFIAAKDMDGLTLIPNYNIELCAMNFASYEQKLTESTNYKKLYQLHSNNRAAYCTCLELDNMETFFKKSKDAPALTPERKEQIIIAICFHPTEKREFFIPEQLNEMIRESDEIEKLTESQKIAFFKFGPKLLNGNNGRTWKVRGPNNDIRWPFKSVVELMEFSVENPTTMTTGPNFEVTLDAAERGVSSNNFNLVLDAVNVDPPLGDSGCRKKIMDAVLFNKKYMQETSGIYWHNNLEGFSRHLKQLFALMEGNPEYDCDYFVEFLSRITDLYYASGLWNAEILRKMLDESKAQGKTLEETFHCLFLAAHVERYVIDLINGIRRQPNASPKLLSRDEYNKRVEGFRHDILDKEYNYLCGRSPWYYTLDPAFRVERIFYDTPIHIS